MKIRLLLLPFLIALLAACDPNSSQRADDQRQSEEKRLAELRDLEGRAVQREAEANAAELALERKRLADEQAGLELERQKLAAEKASIQEDAAKLTQWRAEEKRLQQRQTALQVQQERSAQAEREAGAARERAREAGRQAKQEIAERHLDYFHAPLDPLGDWIEVAPYGHCWQPREARTAGWRPYTDGTWVFTAYGWTWKANEPFGWATYHYGRWARIKRLGWVWVPGSEWAPAWVAWRRSDQYVGWAPLPPEAHSGTGFNSAVDSYYDIGPASYNFVPAASFGEPTYRGIVVEPERNVTIVNQTVNVTKVQYTTVENKTVVFNGGPELAQINASSARPVRRLTLERVSDRPSDSGGSALVGDVLRLLAPRITSASRASVAPTRVKEVVKTAEVERGWSGGDAPAVQAVREQIRQEAGKAERQARVAAPVPPAVPDSRNAAREAEAARLAGEKKLEAERAAAIQAETQKKAMADKAAAAAAKQGEEAKEAKEQRQTEKRAADLKAQTEAAAASAEAGRMAAENKAEAERAAAIQAEAQKKAMADSTAAAAAKQQEEQRKTEKLAAEMKAQTEAAAASGKAARMAAEKKMEAERAAAIQAEARKKAMADSAAAAAAAKQQEDSRKAEEVRKAEKLTAEMKAQAEATAQRAKEAPAPKPLPPSVPKPLPVIPPLPVEPATPIPALPPRAPEPVPPAVSEPATGIEKKIRGAAKKGADQEDKADGAVVVKPAGETPPAAVDPVEPNDAERAAKQKAKTEKKRAEDETAGKADPAK